MDDYGHYGKGTTGYIHYTEGQKGASGGNIGCGTWALILCGAYVVFYIIGAIGSR